MTLEHTKMDILRAMVGNESFRALVKTTCLAVGTYYLTKWFLNMLDPSKTRIKKIEPTIRELLDTLNITAELNEYEMAIASSLVDPKNIQTNWSDIAGMDDIRKQIFNNVVIPMRSVDLHKKSHLYQPPKGVLLTGPPGCGKTMIAKATAKEAGARFINVDVSSLTDKWYGESQKLAGAVFSLAKKIQPCIIFIDEIDSFLRVRESNDHEATAMMKAQFMQLWDGLTSDNQCMVVVMGATNRAIDIDKAFRRRMPIQLYIPLPDRKKRYEILKLILKNEDCTALDIEHIAEITEGFSGSDLLELCRSSYMVRIQELDTSRNFENALNVDLNERRPVTNDDFALALKQFHEARSRICLIPGLD